MDFGGLAAGALDTIWVVAQWLRKQPPLFLIAIPAVFLVLLQVARLLRRRNRALRGLPSHATKAGLASDTRETLKEQLRMRLAEPSALLQGSGLGAPTLGARQVLETDIEAAARIRAARRPEGVGQGHAAAASAHERHGANGKLNGSQAGLLAPARRAVADRQHGDALEAYARAADLAPEMPRRRCWLGVLHLRAGKLDLRRRPPSGARSSSASRRRGRRRRPRYRGQPCSATCLPRARTATRRWQPTRRRSARCWRCLEHEPEKSGLQRDLSVTCDRIGDAHAGKGDLDGALASYRRGFEIAEALAQRDAGNHGWQHDLSVSYDRIGDLLRAEG